MKKIVSLIVASMLAMSLLASCGSKAESKPLSDAQTGVQADVKTVKIGLIQFVEHTSLDEIREAVISRLESEAAAYGFEVAIDYQNAQADISLINSICRQFVDNKVDAIVSIATPAAQGAATVTAGTDIPVIFSAISDPVAAGLVQNIDKPEGNITGTSDAIDVKRIFELAKELTPEVEKFGLIYNKGEANSVSVIEETKKYLDSIGMEYEEKTVANVGEVQQTSRVLLENCDAIFAPIDNTVATGMQVLAAEAIKAQKPVYVAADSMVHDGGLATVGVNYTVLGEKTADMTLKIVSGTAVSEVPVEVMTDIDVVVNEETAKSIGVDVSQFVK